MHAATSAPDSRRRWETPGATAVETEKPLPPSAVTTTLASPGPLEAIWPAVEQPISGTPPERSLIAAIIGSRSYESEQNTTSSFGSSPRSAASAAAVPAVFASWSSE